MAGVMSVQVRLQQALRRALKERDTEAVSALRSALAAIANAEAVPAPQRSGTEVMLGVGPSEVPRRELTEGEVVDVVEAEIVEHRQAAAGLVGLGQDAHVQRLVEQANVLERVLDDL
jgi:uncharacterized protein